MTIEELKQTDWFKERPEIIQQAILRLPPTRLYRIKATGSQCQLYSYEEPESGMAEDVTVTIVKTGVGGALDEIFPELSKGQQVFGYSIDDLEPWDDEVPTPANSTMP